MQDTKAVKRLFKLNGYKEYPITGASLRIVHSDSDVDFFFQKRIADRDGIKYHIDVNFYDRSNYPVGMHQEGFSVVFKVHINGDNKEIPLMSFEQWAEISEPLDFNVIPFEERCEAFFEAMGKPYYEKYCYEEN